MGYGDEIMTTGYAKKFKEKYKQKNSLYFRQKIKKWT